MAIDAMTEKPRNGATPAFASSAKPDASPIEAIRLRKGTPPPAGERGQVRSAFYWYLRHHYGLPNPDRIDTATYRAMEFDPQVRAGVMIRELAILGKPPAFNYAPKNAEDQAEAETGKRMVAFLEWVWGNLNPSGIVLLRNLMSARRFGFACVEKVWASTIDANGEPALQLLEAGDFAGFAYIEKCKLLPPETISRVGMATDEYGNLIAVIQNLATFGRPQSLVGLGGVVPSQSQDYRYRILFSGMDLDRLMIYSANYENGNHYGVSDLQSAYNHWFSKQSNLNGRNVLLERTSGVTIGEYLDEASQGAVQAALEAVGPGAIITVPAGSKVSLLEGWENMVAGYQVAIEYDDRQILQSLLVPPLIIGGQAGDTGSHARAASNFDSFITAVRTIQLELETVIERQFIRPLIRANFGDVEVFPTFDFPELQEKDRAALAQVWKTAVDTGYVDPAIDAKWLRQEMGVPDDAAPDDYVFAKPQAASPFGAGGSFPGLGDSQDNTRPGGAVPVEETEEDPAKEDVQTQAKLSAAEGFDPNQPRNSGGEWTSGGAGKSGAAGEPREASRPGEKGPASTAPIKPSAGVENPKRGELKPLPRTVVDLAGQVKKHIAEWGEEFEFYGLRVANQDHAVGDVLKDIVSRHNPGRADLRDFPEFGSPDYESLPSLDGVSAWGLNPNRPGEGLNASFADSLDRSKTATMPPGTKIYLLGSDRRASHDDPDDNEVLLRDPTVIAAWSAGESKLAAAKAAPDKPARFEAHDSPNSVGLYVDTHEALARAEIGAGMLAHLNEVLANAPQNASEAELAKITIKPGWLSAILDGISNATLRAVILDIARKLGLSRPDVAARLREAILAGASGVTDPQVRLALEALNSYRAWATGLNQLTGEKVAGELQNRLRLRVLQSYAQQRTPEAASRAIADEFSSYTTQQVQTVARTTVMDYYNTARASAYEAAGDYVLGVKFVPVNDARTTPFCQAITGRSISKTDPLYPRLAPPFDYQCRTMTVPVTTDDSGWRFDSDWPAWLASNGDEKGGRFVTGGA